MAVQIYKAVLHMLDPNLGTPVYSDALLEPDGETEEYLATLMEKLDSGDEHKVCAFNPGSVCAKTILECGDFAQLARWFADAFFAVMQLAPEIPSCDLLVADCMLNGDTCLAVLKLNYRTGYTHYYQKEETGQRNSIIKQRTLLPTLSGKADEGFLLFLDSGRIKLVEKKYELDGKKECYLSTRILDCTQARPERAKRKAVEEALEQAVLETYPREATLQPRVEAILREEVRENALPVEQVARRVAEEFPLAAQALEQNLAQAELPMQEVVAMPPARVKRLETHSFRSQDGVEVKIPAALFQDPEAFEFINAPDGTISLLIKRVQI